MIRLEVDQAKVGVDGFSLNPSKNRQSVNLRNPADQCDWEKIGGDGRMIDSSGFRPNVGIILANAASQVFLAKRKGRDAWQFPQGGMLDNERPEETLFRELSEEVGLQEKDVSILGRTRHWLRYRIPRRFIRDTRPVCIGQKQLWYLLQLKSEDSAIHLDTTQKPEFDGWEWVSYWFPLRQVVLFKREVYRRALKELAPYLFEQSFRGWDRRPLDPLVE